MRTQLFEFYRRLHEREAAQIRRRVIAVSLLGLIFFLGHVVGYSLTLIVALWLRG
jgi:hypothetical protein